MQTLYYKNAIINHCIGNCRLQMLENKCLQVAHNETITDQHNRPASDTINEVKGKF